MSDALPTVEGDAGLHSLGVSELLRGYRSQRFTPVDVVEAVLRHSERVNGRVNAFVLIDRQRAVAAATESWRRWKEGSPAWPLDGVPISVKDTMNVKGWPTLRGSHLCSDEPQAESSVVAARLESQGAVLFGKTTTPEYAWKGVTDSPRHGTTRNPWHLEWTPGGSSGGAAAAVAAGCGAIAFGSDAAGSVRIPAAFCQVFGFKPTFGALPIAPPHGFVQQAHLGVMTRSVLDAQYALTSTAGADPVDWSSCQPRIDIAHPTSLKGVRVGRLVSRNHNPSTLEQRAVSSAERRLEAVGASVLDHTFDLTELTDVAATLYRCAVGCIIDGFGRDAQARVDPGILAYVEYWRSTSLRDYMAALHRRETGLAALGEFFACVDLAVSPTLPITPFPAGRLAPSGDGDWFEWNPYTPALNLAHCPAASVPFFDSEGLAPMGVQVVGRRMEDALVLHASGQLEAAFGLRLSPMAARAA